MLRFTSLIKLPFSKAIFQRTFPSTIPIQYKSYFYLCKCNFSNQTNNSQLEPNKEFLSMDKNVERIPDNQEEAYKEIYKNFLENNKNKNLSQKDAQAIVSVVYSLGVFAEKHRDYAEAMRYYREGIDIANMANLKDIFLIMMLNNLGCVLQSQNMPKEGLEYLNKGKELMKAFDFENYDGMLERNILMRGVILSEFGQIEESKELLEEVIPMLEVNPIENFFSLACIPYKSLGLIYYNNHKDYEKAIEVWEQGYHFVLQNYGENQPGLSDLCDCIGDAYLMSRLENRKEKASFYSEKSMELKHKKETVEILDIFNHAIRLFTAEEDNEALSYFEQVICLARDNSDFQEQKAISFVRLAVIYAMKDDTEISRNYFDEGISLCKKVFGPHSNEVTDSYILWIESSGNREEILEEFFEELKDIANNLKQKKDVDSVTHVNFLLLTGQSCYINKDFESMYKYFEECLNCNGESLLGKCNLENLFRMLSCVCLEKKEFEKAEIYAKKGEALSGDLNYPAEETQQIYEGLYKEIKQKKSEIFK